MQKEELKLTIELVPSTSWYNNLRKMMPKSEWDTLRHKVYAKFGHKCAVCETPGRLNCHEVWKYDDEQYKQSLRGFVALCDLCHHIKHIGLAGILASEGRLDYDKLLLHFCEVNNCSIDVFDKHKSQALKVWAKRSEHDWNVDLGEYSRLSSSIGAS